MKNKVFLVSVAVVLATSLVVVGCISLQPPQPPPTKIIVGLARDLDEEPLGFFECYGAGPVYRWFVAHVNEDVGQAGKIHLSAYDAQMGHPYYVPIELWVRDFDIATWDVANVTEGLILDGADFIWGGPVTDCIYTQASVCNNYTTLLIALEGGNSQMIWGASQYLDNWPYVFVHQSFANWYQLPVLHDMLVAEGVATPKAYVTWIGGPGSQLGIEYLEETKNVFGTANVIDSGAHPYSMNQAMANTIIQNAAAALSSTPYDIFCAFTYPWNVELLTQACIDNDFNPPAIIFGQGANFQSYGENFGSNATGILCFATANNKTVPNVGTPTMTMAEMYGAIADQIEDDWIAPDLPCDSGNLTMGEQALDYWGGPCYVAALEMWKEAVERVGYISSSWTRFSLVAFSSTSSTPAQTVFGDTWYTVFGGGLGGGILAHECHTGGIGQWQDGYVEIVGYTGIENDPMTPNYDVTANFTYPMTNLWGWLP